MWWLATWEAFHNQVEPKFGDRFLGIFDGFFPPLGHRKSYSRRDLPCFRDVVRNFNRQRYGNVSLLSGKKNTSRDAPKNHSKSDQPILPCSACFCFHHDCIFYTKQSLKQDVSNPQNCPQTKARFAESYSISILFFIAPKGAFCLMPSWQSPRHNKTCKTHYKISSVALNSSAFYFQATNLTSTGSMEIDFHELQHVADQSKHWLPTKSITCTHRIIFIWYYVLPFRRFISYHFISSPIISYHFEKSSTIPTPKRHVSGTHSASHRDRQLVTLGRKYILPAKLNMSPEKSMFFFVFPIEIIPF